MQILRDEIYFVMQIQERLFDRYSGWGRSEITNIRDENI